MSKFSVRSLVMVAAPTTIVLSGVLGTACHGSSPYPPPPSSSEPPDMCSQGSAIDQACQSTETVTTSAVTPPPITGGTLLIARDGVRAVVSDPERDRILLVDVAKGTVLSVIPTPANAHPFRAVEDDQGRFHVVLRDGGGVLTIVGIAASAVTATCPAPRGITYAPNESAIYVACAGGELVRLQPADAPAVVTTVMLGPDLRDVVASPTKLFVTHFRSAAVDLVSFAGNRLKTVIPPGEAEGGPANPTFSPDVAWRAVARPGGGIYVVHQQALSSPVSTPVGGGGYNGNGFGDCASAAVHGAITRIDDDGNLFATQSFFGLPLPVDLALSKDGTVAAIVGAGRGSVRQRPMEDWLTVRGCSTVPDPSQDVSTSVGQRPTPVAAAYDGAGELVTQHREPSALEVHDGNGNVVRIINLGGDSRADTGFDLFQGDPDSPVSPFGNVSSNITCASCHPEGGDDGHVWSFDVGLRRTMSLAGDVTQRAPFHWKGDLRDMSAIMHDIFTVRMGGAPQSADRVKAIASYLATIPRLPSASGLDSAAVDRGKTLFESADTQCTECHAGDQLTNRAIVDVGTGETFKVPSLLGLGMRAPYLHDGSAPTLADRFKVQGGGDKHGHTSQLTSAQISDLVAYLSSL